MEDSMKKANVRSGVSSLVCLLFAALLLTGCSSTTIFSYLKFPGTSNPPPVREAEPGEVAAFVSQVRQVKGNPDSHYLLAVHYQQRGMHRKALEEFTKTVRIDPLYAKAYNGM